jgi:hypothetical protein
MAIAKLIESMKVESSAWLKRQAPSLSAFHWQAGYGAFLVSPSNADPVKAYIANQEERHRRMSFQEEYRTLLQRHGIEFDERYVWA